MCSSPRRSTPARTAPREPRCGRSPSATPRRRDRRRNALASSEVPRRRPTKEAARKIVRAARSGNMEAAALAELALRGIRNPTPEQVAGATLRALHADDVRKLREAYVTED